METITENWNSYYMPGEFMVTLDEHGTVVGYTFLPSYADAPYHSETGEIQDYSEQGRSPFWAAVTASLGNYQDHTRINVPVTWEG
jgi:hypothetical protein